MEQPLGRRDGDAFPLPQSVAKRDPPRSLLKRRPPSPQSVITSSLHCDGKGKEKVPDESLSSPLPPPPESILCRKCNLCRCRACREPRRLPEYYLCNQKWSSETVVDALSGMCLVKALLYHCGKDYAPGKGRCQGPFSCEVFTSSLFFRGRRRLREPLLSGRRPRCPAVRLSRPPQPRPPLSAVLRALQGVRRRLPGGLRQVRGRRLSLRGNRAALRPRQKRGGPGLDPRRLRSRRRKALAG